jgi:integrase
MSKRANGEGSIYLRKDGRWVGAAYVLMPDGHHRRKQVYGRTRKQVAEKLAEMLSRSNRGLPAEATQWSLNSYVDHWRKHIAPGKLRPSTRSAYDYCLDQHILPALGPQETGPADHGRRPHVAGSGAGQEVAAGDEAAIRRASAGLDPHRPVLARGASDHPGSGRAR